MQLGPTIFFYISFRSMAFWHVKYLSVCGNLPVRIISMWHSVCVTLRPAQYCRYDFLSLWYFGHDVLFCPVILRSVSGKIIHRLNKRHPYPSSGGQLIHQLKWWFKIWQWSRKIIERLLKLEHCNNKLGHLDIAVLFDVQLMHIFIVHSISSGLEFEFIKHDC